MKAALAKLDPAKIAALVAALGAFVKIPERAKAYVALAGAVATALLGVFAADTVVGQILVVVTVVATGVATWVVPNRVPEPVEPEPVEPEPEA